jgi:tight adherence protein B
MIAGAALVFVGVTTLLATLLRPRRVVRLTPSAVERGSGPRGDRANGIGDLAKRISGVAERTLEDSGRRALVDAKLEEAGLTVRAGELVVLVGAIALLSFLLVGAVMGPIVGVAVAIVVVAGAFAFVDRRVGKRREAFADQLDELLQMVAGSLRAGYALPQAVEAASREMESPAADELRRVTTEVRLGRDLVESLDGMAARVGNEDFGWVVQAMRIHREVGGDLGEVLDRVGETIRARAKLHRQVRAISAEGRVSAWVLSGLPFFMVAAMSVLNPGYLGLLFGTAIGIAMLIGAAVLMTVGVLWLRKLIRPVF